jgi:hypothetical protein
MIPTGAPPLMNKVKKPMKTPPSFDSLEEMYTKNWHKVMKDDKEAAVSKEFVKKYIPQHQLEKALWETPQAGLPIGGAPQVEGSLLQQSIPADEKAYWLETHGFEVHPYKVNQDYLVFSPKNMGGTVMGKIFVASPLKSELQLLLAECKKLNKYGAVDGMELAIGKALLMMEKEQQALLPQVKYITKVYYGPEQEAPPEPEFAGKLKEESKK